MQKKARLFLYPSWFLFCFMVSVYLTFPVELIRSQVISAAEMALGKNDKRKVGRHGVNPKVEIGKLSLYHLSGLSFENLSIQLASQNPDPGTTIAFDEFNVKVGIFGALVGSPSVAFNGSLFDGEFAGELDYSNTPSLFSMLSDDEEGAKSKPNKEKLDAFELDIEDITLERAPALLEKIGLPLTGQVNAQIRITTGETPSKDAEGTIEMTAEGLSIGPGEIKIPMMGPLTIPLIDMGKLSAVLPISKGKGKTKECRLKGKDFGGELTLDLSIVRELMNSRLSGGGSFLVDSKFLERNGKFKTILDFPGPLQKAKDGDNRFHFLIKGTGQNPKFSLSKTGGKDKSSRSKRGRKKK
jgi:type II secretion system protein N